MKVKLTEKFHPNRKGHVVDLSDKFAEALIKDGKAQAVEAKAKGKGKKEVEVEVEEPQAPEANEAPEADAKKEGEEIVIE
jgi:hypothetical protein